MPSSAQDLLRLDEAPVAGDAPHACLPPRESSESRSECWLPPPEASAPPWGWLPSVGLVFKVPLELEAKLIFGAPVELQLPVELPFLVEPPHLEVIDAIDRGLPGVDFPHPD